MELENEMKRNPIHIAAEQGNCEITQFLVHEGFDPNAKDHNGDTALHSVVNRKIPNLKMISCLAELGSDFHAKNNQGKTPIQLVTMGKWDHTCLKSFLKSLDLKQKSGRQRLQTR